MIKNRVASIYISMLILFGLLAARLYYLAENVIYRDIIQTAESQGFADVQIAQRRGFIFDRNCEAIAGIADGFVTAVDCTEISDDEKNKICAALSASSSEMISADNIRGRIAAGKLFTLRTSDCFNEDYAFSMPLYKRYTGIAPHILGYLDGDGMGVCGIEGAYDRLLTMTAGQLNLNYHVNAAGKLLGGYPIIINDVAYSGAGGLTLTLDAQLQKYVQQFDIAYGSVMVCDAYSGEILCAASFPGYNQDNVSGYLDSDGGELINRCSQSFTPGSVFKVVTAAAAVEMNSELCSVVYECDGTKCYGGIAHGIVNMKQAMEQSCNEYFIKTAESIGVERIRSMSERIGIGKPLTADLINFGCGKFDGSVLPNAAIGQGGTMVTPGEITLMMCAAVNGGRRPVLSLVKKITYADGTYTETGMRETERIFSVKIADCLNDMLRGVVDDGIGGAARGDISEEYDIGGKTASAQSGQYRTDETGKKNEIIHSWFSGYVSRGGRSVVITVLLEGGGSGASAYFSKTAEKVIGLGYFE